MNGFDEFDTQVSAEEFYAGWTEDEADYITGDEGDSWEDTVYPHDLDGYEYPEFDA